VARRPSQDRLTSTRVPTLTKIKRAAVGVGLLLNGLIAGSWLPRIPEIRDRLVMDLGGLGLTLALGGLGALVGSSVSGVVVARLGSTSVALSAGALLVLLLPLIAVAPTAALFGVLLAIIGFFDSVADVGMNAVGIRVEEMVGRSIMTRLMASGAWEHSSDQVRAPWRSGWGCRSAHAWSRWPSPDL
jgi:hypothetical protein